MNPIGPVSTKRMTLLAAASSIGTTLEWYDFIVYNLMAALVFNKVFFPSFDPLSGTLLAFSTYAVGYLSRPIGGIVFGHLGDRRGRRFVLVATLLIMGIVTCLIGLLPSYEKWGAWSPAILVLLRFLQGTAIGGEWAGAVLLSIEHGSQRQRGRNGSFAQIGPACGTLLGTAAVATINQFLAPASFESWGWRIPFALSAVLVGFGLWLRRRIEETPAFRELELRQDTAKAPLSEVVRQHLCPLLISIGSRVGPDVCYAMLVVFTLTYITTVLHLSRGLALTCTMVGAACHAIAIPYFAGLSDRLGRRPVCAAGAVGSIVWVFVYFNLLDTRNPWLIGLAVAVGLTIHAALYGPQAAFIAEQFPTRVRYAGSSLAYTLTGVVAGGIAPLVFTAIYKASASTVWVSVYIAVAFVITLIALRTASETAGGALPD